MSELVGPAQWPKPGSGGTGGGTGTVTDVASPDTSLQVTTPHSTVKLRVENSPRIDGVHVTGTPSAGEVITATSATTAHWAAGGGGGGADLTVNSGPLHSSGLLPLAVTSQPLVPPSGVIQPLPPLAGFQFPGTTQHVTLPATHVATRTICAGRDGNLWVVCRISGASAVVRVTPTGATTAFPIAATHTHPIGICSGPDGNLWIADTTARAVWRVIATGPTAGTVTKFTLAGATAYGICSGPDGNLWIGVATGHTLLVVNTTGTILHTITGLTGANWPAAGPDGNVWVQTTVGTVVGIARITPTFVLTQFAVAGVGGATSVICAGPDGNLWMTIHKNTGTPAVARITPAGVSTVFNLPTATATPFFITAGAGGDLWISDHHSYTVTAGRLWRLTVEGVFTAFELTRSQSSICVGADGSFWLVATHFLLRVPFLMQTGGLVLTALPTTDPTNPSEVWADTGTLVLSGHTAGGGLSAKSASFTPPATPTTSITVANGANGPIVWGSKTDPTTLITAISTDSWKVTQSGLYIINILVRPVTAMTPGGSWSLQIGTSTHANIYLIAPAPPNSPSILTLAGQLVVYMAATEYFNVEIYNRDGVAARKFQAGAGGSCRIQKIA